MPFDLVEDPQVTKPVRTEEDLEFNWMSATIRFRVQQNKKAFVLQHLVDGEWCSGKIPIGPEQYDEETEFLNVGNLIRCADHPDFQGRIVDNIWQEYAPTETMEIA